LFCINRRRACIFLGMSDVTRIIEAAGNGDAAATQALLPAVYQELRLLARRHMSHERVDHTLNATALVHEAYVRLVGDGSTPRWDGRAHFFTAAAEAMRRILIDHARRRAAVKRGGAMDRVSLVESDLPPIAAPCPSDAEELLRLDDALRRFTEEDPAKAELVKLLYFAGLSLAEAAGVLGISKTAAHRQWVYARAWLHDAMVGRGCEAQR
jgi:RNA polymerase sigma factor (TIGR02999 family)